MTLESYHGENDVFDKSFPFQCLKCSSKFQSVQEVKWHNSKEHGIQLFECEDSSVLIKQELMSDFENIVPAANKKGMLKNEFLLKQEPDLFPREFQNDMIGGPWIGEEGLFPDFNGFERAILYDQLHEELDIKPELENDPLDLNSNEIAEDTFSYKNSGVELNRRGVPARKRKLNSLIFGIDDKISIPVVKKKSLVLKKQTTHKPKVLKPKCPVVIKLTKMKKGINDIKNETKADVSKSEILTHKKSEDNFKSIEIKENHHMTFHKQKNGKLLEEMQLVLIPNGLKEPESHSNESDQNSSSKLQDLKDLHSLQVNNR